MNSNVEIKYLGHGDVHKKIIEAPVKPRPLEDHLGPFNKYNDENYEIYLEKRRQFLDASKKYEKLTRESFNCFKTQLHDDYISKLDLNFLKDDSKMEHTVVKNEQDSNGKLLRKRTERPIHEVPEEDKITRCNLDTWFRKYLIINKFISVGRKVILMNRMLKNLEKLNNLNKENVKQFEIIPKIYVGSYKEVFAKFIQS